MSYGDDWTKRGTKLEFAKIIVAPEIFTVKERLDLPGGKTVMKGARYFSWTMARDLVMHKKTPAGWRMMTLDEAEAIQAYCNNSQHALLVCGLDGFITPGNIIEYHYSPEREDHLILCKGQQGDYWINGLSNALYPYVMENSGMKLRTNSIYISYGLPLILVKDL